jgi:hypothetical protein
MTTILEFLLTKYLGNPARELGNGISYWPCPVCGHKSFHTLPLNPKFKHRAKCRNAGCEFRGDALDMLKHFHANEPYNVRQSRFYDIQREWEKQNRGLVLGRGVAKQ